MQANRIPPLPAFALLAAAAATAAAPAQAQHLTAAMAAPITSIDPHFYNAAPNNGLALHVYERLVERTPTAELTPGLAASWTAIGEAMWELKLRPGATWHDGSPVTPDDVAFTFARVPNVPNSPGGFAGMIRAVARVEAVDATTLRIHTSRPTPNLPIDMVSIHIVSRKHGEGAATEDYNSGKAAIGSGLFRLTRYTNGDRTELTRYDGWVKEKPAMDAVTDRALSTFDPAQRERLLVQAVEMATNDVAIIPLHQLVNFWATKKSIAYTPRMDERTVAMNAKPAP